VADDFVLISAGNVAGVAERRALLGASVTGSGW